VHSACITAFYEKVIKVKADVAAVLDWTSQWWQAQSRASRGPNDVFYMIAAWCPDGAVHIQGTDTKYVSHLNANGIR